MIHEKIKKIAFGGDYNPEQWPEEIWKEDMRITKLADIDIMTINVFAWAILQPNEDTYDFSLLDQVMDMLEQEQINVCLGTSTAVHPAWMAAKYEDVLRVDFDGRKRKFGLRHNSCPNSPTFQKYSTKLAEKLAERYQNHPALVLWHVSNEYGGDCYCDNCEKAFRVWLKNKYQSLAELNRVWNTSFWGHTFYDWDEIVLPNNLSEHLGSYDYTAFQGISLDYRRFNSDSMLECYKMEYNALKKFTPDVLVTTNLMGAYKQLDYQKWAKYMDIISWDSYPSVDSQISQEAMKHDLMRGLKQGDPFMLMEQTPSVTNWQPYNALKRPGVMRLWSYQAVARGADTIMFFQIRRSIGACEKFHGAVIDHVGHEHTRVFRECAALGHELTVLGDQIINSRIQAKAAIVFDWDNWWAVELSSGPSRDLNYFDEVSKYYQAFYEQNIQVDMIGVDDPIDQYSLVIAPVLYMTKDGFAQKIEEYTAEGGTFVTTFFSGIVDEHDLVITGGYPGQLRKILGIWVEEIDALPPGRTNEIVMQENSVLGNTHYSCSLLCDLLHTEGAEVMAVYGQDFYQGTPCVTRHSFGKGSAWYIASSPEQSFLDDYIRSICEESGIQPVLGKAVPKGVEVTKRIKNDKELIFILNHNEKEERIELADEYIDLVSKKHYQYAVEIAAKDVRIIVKK